MLNKDGYEYSVVLMRILAAFSLIPIARVYS